MTKTLSALVVVHNEEEQLPQCLSALQFADELVVVLDKCTDQSKNIALQFRAKIVEGAWDIEGDRRNTGIQACSSDFILEVDADERIPEPLAKEIRMVINTTPYDYFRIPVDNYIGTRLVKHGWGGSFGVRAEVALFRPNAKRWGQGRVHPPVTLTGEAGEDLKNPYIHYMDRDIRETLARLMSYVESRALDINDGRIKPGSTLGNIRRFFSRFFRCYIRRKGYKEGIYGLVIATCAGLFPVLSALRAREMLIPKD